MPSAQLSQQVGSLIWLAGCAAAAMWGGPRERWTAAILLIDLASVELMPGMNHDFQTQVWTALGDLLVIVGLALLWARYGRTGWIEAAIGFQTLSILAHIPSLFDPAAAAWGYIAVTNCCGYAVVGALAFGALASHSRSSADARP